MTPESFKGKFSIPRKSGFMLFPEKEEDKNKSFDVYFYRRETEKYSLEDFLVSITPENIGWDNPTKQLYYRSEEGILYKLNFEKVKP